MSRTHTHGDPYCLDNGFCNANYLLCVCSQGISRQATGEQGLVFAGSLQIDVSTQVFIEFAFYIISINCYSYNSMIVF